jgi:hypothetical protein
LRSIRELNPSSYMRDRHVLNRRAQ